VMLKNGKMRCYCMPSNNEAYYKSEVFGRVLGYVQQHPKQCRMKDSQNKLIISMEDIGSVSEALGVLRSILRA
jgi:transcription-repair coupling factor (superfamily II helicase)